jgi:hypothetical protein
MGPKGRRQFGALLLQQGVGGCQRPDQRRDLKGGSLPLKQGTGEGHAFCLVVSLTDAGMELAHPGPEPFAQLSIRWAGVIGNGREHQGNPDNHQATI